MILQEAGQSRRSEVLRAAVRTTVQLHSPPGGIFAMPNANGKYRGTTTYFHVLAELVRAAQYRGLTTYQDIALLMGLPLSGSYMGKEVGLILGEISEDELRAGRPMLSSVAVGVNGKAGSGFFGLARELGRLDQNADESVFWKDELLAAYSAWRRPLPPSN